MIIFSAPSGAGKTTIVKRLLKHRPYLEFSISACTRGKRNKEIDGKDYYFLTVNDFKEKIRDNAFIEWEEVYTDHFYGTLKSEVYRIWKKGKYVIFDVDVVGGLNIKKQFGSQALSLFVEPPSIEELKKRLINRSEDSKENIQKRVAKAKQEMTYAKQFDIVIINKNIDVATGEAIAVVSHFLDT
ncbi:MAG: guanylate kinase [Bacteroidales bacterium]|nr:guanylate kinase [Bacteroidales bacterium]